MNKVLISVVALIFSVLLSIVGIIAYYAVDTVGITIRPVSSWAVIVIVSVAVVFAFLFGIKFMSNL